MGKYLFSGTYIGDGVSGLLAEGGTKRRDAAEALVKSLGGNLECMYYAFGDIDTYGICELPDDASAAAMSLMATSSGRVTITVTPLMTPEEVDGVVGKTADYRAPGT